MALTHGDPGTNALKPALSARSAASSRDSRAMMVDYDCNITRSVLDDAAAMNSVWPEASGMLILSTITAHFISAVYTRRPVLAFLGRFVRACGHSGCLSRFRATERIMNQDIMANRLVLSQFSWWSWSRWIREIT